MKINQGQDRSKICASCGGVVHFNNICPACLRPICSKCRRSGKGICPNDYARLSGNDRARWNGFVTMSRRAAYAPALLILGILLGAILLFPVYAGLSPVWFSMSLILSVPLLIVLAVTMLRRISKDTTARLVFLRSVFPDRALPATSSELLARARPVSREATTRLTRYSNRGIWIGGLLGTAAFFVGNTSIVTSIGNLFAGVLILLLVSYTYGGVFGQIVGLLVGGLADSFKESRARGKQDTFLLTLAVGACISAIIVIGLWGPVWKPFLSLLEVPNDLVYVLLGLLIYSILTIGLRFVVWKVALHSSSTKVSKRKPGESRP